MKRRRLTGNHWVLLALTIVVLIAGAEFGRRTALRPKVWPAVPRVQPATEPVTLLPGDPAPAFVLPDASGTARSLDEARKGQRTLLVSLCGCPECQRFVGFVHDLHSETATPLPNEVAIATFPKESEDSFRRDSKFGGLILYEEPQGPVVAKYAGTLCPRAYLIDADGKFEWISSPNAAKMPAIGMEYATTTGLADEAEVMKVMEAMMKDYAIRPE